MNYPDLDLRFSNDTDHWLLLRTFVGAGSLTVNLYGTPVDRRVERRRRRSSVTGPVPVKEIDDPSLAKGKRVVDELGAPPRETSVRRLVYDANGNVLYDNTWRSFYVGEPSLVRVGTKAPAKKPGAKPKKPPPRAGAPPCAATPAESPATDRRARHRHDSRSAVAIAVHEPRWDARRLPRRGVDRRVERLGRRDELPSRSIRYSYRNRAPRMSTHRRWIVSTSSNAAAAR